MASVFEAALRSLPDTSQQLTGRVLGLLSGPTRGESQAFATLWPTLTVERRREIAARMVELCEDRFDLDYGALFRVCLADPDAEIRRLAIDGLWEDEGFDLVNIFLRLMQTDPDIMVRATAASSLGKFMFMAECEELDAAYTARIRPALEQVINNPEEDPEVVRRAVEAISYINDDRVRDIIERTYAQREERMKVSALFAMGRNADPYWADIITAELTNASAALRFEAARASGELQLKRAVPLLIDLINDNDDEVRAMAVWALGQVGGKEAEATLHRISKSKNEALRDAALEALGELEFLSGRMDMMIHNAETDLDDLTEVNLEEDAIDSDDDDTDDEAWDDDPLELE
jgi:HEAT repeat protein